MNNDIQDITNEDINLGKLILQILKSDVVILMSWGFNSPIVIKMGLRFKVNGFKLKNGTISIKYNGGSDLFDLTFNNQDGTVRNTLEGIYFDELGSVIDDQVEMIENYNERVSQLYNFLSNEE